MQQAKPKIFIICPIIGSNCQCLYRRFSILFMIHRLLFKCRHINNNSTFCWKNLIPVSIPCQEGGGSLNGLFCAPKLFGERFWMQILTINFPWEPHGAQMPTSDWNESPNKMWINLVSACRNRISKWRFSW